jgi:hypothetical protein
VNQVSRRGALKVLASGYLSSGFRLRAEDPSTFPLQAEETSEGFRLQAEVTTETLLPLAAAVLPSELGADGQRKAVDAFVRWIREYREGADTDHGYGNTRIRATGPSPARNYAAQLTALDAAATAKGAASFAAATIDVRRAIIEAALADAKIERLPARPNGGHIAADLMGHYFNSPDGANLCYKAEIDRDSCRGLPGSENRPRALR